MDTADLDTCTDSPTNKNTEMPTNECTEILTNTHFAPMIATPHCKWNSNVVSKTSNKSYTDMPYSEKIADWSANKRIETPSNSQYTPVTASLRLNPNSNIAEKTTDKPCLCTPNLDKSTDIPANKLMEMSTKILTNSHSSPVTSTLRHKLISNVTNKYKETLVTAAARQPNTRAGPIVIPSWFSDQFGSNVVRDRQKPERVNQPSPTEKADDEISSEIHC